MVIAQQHKRHGKNTGKPDLLLLPGMVCNHLAWQKQLVALSDIANVTIISYNKMETFSQIASEILSKAPKKFLLAGHSMGARIALEMARQSSERIIGLCLIGTEQNAAPTGVIGEKEQKSREQLLNIAQNQGMQKMAEAWIPHLLAPENVTDNEMVITIIDMISSHSSEQLASHINAGAQRKFAGDVLSNLQIPILLLAGESDQIRTLDMHKAMLASTNNGVLHVISQSGHMPTIEQPDQVNQHMRKWILHTGIPETANAEDKVEN